MRESCWGAAGPCGRVSCDLPVCVKWALAWFVSASSWFLAWFVSASSAFLSPGAAPAMSALPRLHAGGAARRVAAGKSKHACFNAMCGMHADRRLSLDHAYVAFENGAALT